jgi:predicted nucleic acid-binding protein
MLEKQSPSAETRYGAVIVNTSPLLCLHQIHHLELFRELYGTLLVPTAVNSD